MLRLPAVNETLGSYRILRSLGEGGMGAVYEVEHLQLGVHYALKAYVLDDSHAELFRKRFAAEGRLLARSNHPNLVRVIDLAIDEASGLLYYVMDLVFFEQYQPVIQKFAAFAGAGRESEDVTQDVFVKLVDVFRNGRYDPKRGSFRAYLATMIRREVINRWHKAAARAADQHVSIDIDDRPVDLAVPSETATILDAKWRLACHQAAVEHVLTKTALAERSKAIYRAYVLDERPIDDVATAFAVTNNVVSQTKTRVERMIAEHEALLGE